MHTHTYIGVYFLLIHLSLFVYIWVYACFMRLIACPWKFKESPDLQEVNPALCPLRSKDQPSSTNSYILLVQYPRVFKGKPSEIDKKHKHPKKG